jgi:hypothetical protein
MYSRIRSAGADQGMLNRRSICARICEPMPSTNRPWLNVFRSLATAAIVIGLRANATATAVPSSNVEDFSAATSNGKNGSRVTSVDQTPSKPTRSAAAICSVMTPKSAPPVPSMLPPILPSTCTRAA